MKILGISAHYHDSAAALVIDGVPVAAVQEERLSRKKHDAGFPLAAIEWCLDSAGLEPDALDAVVFYEKPMLKLERILVTALRAFPRSWRSFPRALMNSFGGKVWVKGLISSHLRVPGDKIFFTEHHQAHAAYAYFTAPTRRAALVTADGVGEWATFTVGRGEGARVELTSELRWPHSLGMLYSTFTAFLGFTVNEDEYKVMGLAAYGQPRFAAEVRSLVRHAADGGFALDLDAFDYHTSATRSWSPRFEAIFGRPRAPFEAIELDSDEGRRFADLAASVQLVLEDEMVAQCRRVHDETGLSDLCLGGGVALNVRANARILAEAGFERVFVPPAPGDAGCALGAALLVSREHFQEADRPLPDHPYWGPSVDGADLAAVAREDGLPVEEANGTLVARVAAELAAGKVVGWMDGAAELGPRALGNRSILAAPHDPAMRDRVNQKIKFREEFRPFAPVVPAEVADRWFELPPGGARLGRFMSGVFKVRAPEKLGAVTHVDGSARVQVVDAEMAPRLHALLLEYGRLTGVPVLLNTSFNLAGEPIVTTAREGYSTFRRSGLDALAAPGVLVHKARGEERAAAAPLEAMP